MEWLRFSGSVGRGFRRAHLRGGGRRALPAGQSERHLGNVSGPREKPGATREVTQGRMAQNAQARQSQGSQHGRLPCSTDFTDGTTEASRFIK